MSGTQLSCTSEVKKIYTSYVICLIIEKLKLFVRQWLACIGSQSLEVTATCLEIATQVEVTLHIKLDIVTMTSVIRKFPL